MSIQFGEGDVMLVIRPPQIRRAISIAAILGAALILFSFAFSSAPHGAVPRTFLVLFGLAMLALGRRFYNATAVGLELTQDELRDTAGQVLCRMDDIDKVERGVFALKPSNGLVLQINQGGPWAWNPGLWWRFGRRLGIGGATTPAQTRAVAETINLIIKDRDGSLTGRIP